MQTESQASVADVPLLAPAVLLRFKGVPLAIVGTDLHPSVLPFEVRACTREALSSSAEVDAVQLSTAKEWKLEAKASIDLIALAEGADSCRHWVLAFSECAAADVALPIDDTTASGIESFLEVLSREFYSAFGGCTAPLQDVRVFIMSEPSPDAAVKTVTETNIRVFFADSPAELANLTGLVLREHFVEGKTAPTSVFWPTTGLPFPVNVHAENDGLRRAEHEALGLPWRGLLHPHQCAAEWHTAADLRAAYTKQQQEQQQQVREQHLVTNPHKALRHGPLLASAAGREGARTLLTSGVYDYYHYRVDGFKDDGWGCAYRSLQTILSWFQHEGLLPLTAMPSLREIQQILFAVDPDKAGRREFVGSREWIGSYEVMLVLQHYLPGLECTLKRLESGAALDTDPAVQDLLCDHFGHLRAAPVMIGGSSYAHTILGVHVNRTTAEAQYLVLDPHYSACPTNLKTAINKGYVGWKDASKFFEADKWYNVCMPRTDLYDPR